MSNKWLELQERNDGWLEVFPEFAVPVESMTNRTMTLNAFDQSGRLVKVIGKFEIMAIETHDGGKCQS